MLETSPFPGGRSQGDEISVYDTSELYGEKGRFRVLQFSGEAAQGALDLEQPRRIVFEYPRAMIHLMEHNMTYFEDVFMIGHGIGTIAGHYPDKRFKVAEIHPEVVRLSREHFGYALDNVSIGDGRALLALEPDRRYDYIIVDAFTSSGTPQHLSSSEFFALTRSKLHRRGYLLLNLMGRSDNDRKISAVLTTLGEHYSHAKAFVLLSGGPADLCNFILIAGDQPIRYQARHLAGFTETEPAPGHIIRDSR